MVPFIMSTICVPCSTLSCWSPDGAANSQVFFTVDSEVGISQQTFRPAFEGLNQVVLGRLDSPQLWGQIVTNLNFLGQLVTVLAGVGHSVPVSKHGLV
jgi:hypothetical protein